MSLAYDEEWQKRPTTAPDGLEAPRPFVCGVCDCRFASHQQLTAHRFAVHREPCLARQLAKGTVCRVCLSQYWTEARLARHLQHDSMHCLACLIEHDYTEQGEPARPDPSCARLPAVKLSGPRLPLAMPLAEIAASIAECSSAAAMWAGRWQSPAIERWVEAAQLATADLA